MVVFVSMFLDQKEFVETITELMSIIDLKTPMIYAVEHILTLEPATIGHCAWYVEHELTGPHE